MGNPRQEKHHQVCQLISNPWPPFPHRTVGPQPASPAPPPRGQRRPPWRLPSRNFSANVEKCKFLCKYQRNANYGEQVAAPELFLDDLRRWPVGRFRQRVRKLTKHLIQDCLSQMISNRVESWHCVSGYLAYYVRSGCFSQRELIWFGDRQLANARYCIKSLPNMAISALVNVWDIWRIRIPHARFLSMSTFGLEMRTHPTHVTLAQCTAHNEGFGQDGNIQQRKHEIQQFLLAMDLLTIDFICLFVGHTFLLTLHHLFYT